MAGPLQRLTPGQALKSLPAATWNRFADAAAAVESQIGRPTPGRYAPVTEAQFVQLVNDTNGDREPFQVVKYGDHALNFPSNNTTLPERLIPAALAQEPETGQRFGILSTAVQDGDYSVTAQVAGLAYCLVDIKDTDDTLCGPIDGQYTHLDSGTGSTPILAKALADEVTKTGVQWCVVLLANPVQRANLQYAIVTTEAAVATHSGTAGTDYAIDPDTAGECNLLEWNWTGTEWELQEDTASGAVKFYNGYTDAAITEGSVIVLYSPDPIVPGEAVNAATKTPYARYAEINDYLEALEGWQGDVAQVLYHDDTGKLKWGRRVC